ncbi:hypothetical protein HTG_14005 [Natrinema mahii]|nr:hypothetical protein HTG_14005 [Natrinema mahii]
MNDDRERWNERYEDGDREPHDDPVPVLERRIETLPDGRALDVATGTGRNALFLAAHGYDVDAVDVSDEAIATARERAAERGLAVDWIRTNVAEFEPEPATYDLVVVSYFAALEYLPALKDALAPGGVLVYEHHLRSSDPVAGPSTDRHRYRSNDLLRACLDLTVLSYTERRRPTDDGEPVAVATLVARRSSGGTQSYPLVPDDGLEP